MSDRPVNGSIYKWSSVLPCPRPICFLACGNEQVNLTKDEAIVHKIDSICNLPMAAGAGYFSFMAPLLNVLRWSTNSTAVPFCCCCFPQETAAVQLNTPHGGDVEALLGLDLCCHPSRTPNTYQQGELFSGSIRQLLAAARGFVLSPATTWTKQKCCGTSALSVGGAGDATAVRTCQLCCSKSEEREGVFVQDADFIRSTQAPSCFGRLFCCQRNAVEVVVKGGQSITAGLALDQVSQAHKQLANVLVGGIEANSQQVIANVSDNVDHCESLCLKTRSSAKFTPGIVTITRDHTVAFGMCNVTEVTTVNATSISHVTASLPTWQLIFIAVGRLITGVLRVMRGVMWLLCCNPFPLLIAVLRLPYLAGEAVNAFTLFLIRCLCRTSAIRFAGSGPGGGVELAPIENSTSLLQEMRAHVAASQEASTVNFTRRAELAVFAQTGAPKNPPILVLPVPSGSSSFVVVSPAGVVPTMPPPGVVQAANPLYGAPAPSYGASAPLAPQQQQAYEDPSYGQQQDSGYAKTV